MRLLLSEQVIFYLISKNNVNFTETRFLNACMRMRKYAQIYYVKSVPCMLQFIYTVIQSLRSYNTLKVKFNDQ